MEHISQLSCQIRNSSWYAFLWCSYIIITFIVNTPPSQKKPKKYLHANGEYWVGIINTLNLCCP